jgi:hypothetical protein
MRPLLLSRITLVWIVLLAATTVSLLMGHGIGIHDARHAGVAILVIALVKVRFVILDFMEIRRAPTYMRVTAETWVTIICTALVTLFLIQ